MEPGWQKKPDGELLAHWQQNPGSPDADQIVTELLQRYRMKVYRWCGRFINDPDRALDLTQDILLSAYQNLGNIPQGASFPAWLFVITRNACFGELRKLKIRRGDDRTLDQLVDPGRTPEEELLQQLAEEDFLKLLSSVLTPLEQKAINLRCFEKLPVETITEMLDLETASGARGILQKARRKLKAAMKRRPE